MPGPLSSWVQPRRKRLFAVSLVALVSATGLAVGSHVADGRAASGCPAGYAHLHVDRHDGGVEVGREEGEDEPGTGPCWGIGAPPPESFLDLAENAAARTNSMGLSTPGAMAAGIRQSALLASSGIPNTTTTWSPVGDGHMQSTDGSYPASGYGTTIESGRLSGYALGNNGVVYAAAANGGVWKSADQGQSWTDISLSLPNQIVGALGWSPSGGSLGTLFALTGDNSFGQYNWSGTGLYYSTDEGASWTHASGIPDGALAFKVAVAPDTPTTVYAATGAGLYRSTDTGHTWSNVQLPTLPAFSDGSHCWDAKRRYTEPCALSNIVTDVVVRGKDTFGHTGGAVVAAVGWRAGDYKNADGTPQAPANGLYESASGAVGSFAKLADGSGFPDTVNVGRVSFGNAYGPKQNHDYLYALVEDAQKMQSGGYDMDGLDTGIVPKYPTYIMGAYVSSDFGKTWKTYADLNDFMDPASGSALTGLSALGIAPGVQSWYNNWIQPDPYQVDPLGSGAPTDLLLGLEEIWETSTPGTPQTGKQSIRVVAPYAGGTFECVIAGSPCGTAVQSAGVTSTHADQHGVLFLPPPATGARRILTTSDGGNYTADVPLAGMYKQTDFVAHQDGFNTLLPYSMDVSSDGTVLAGLQDNGDIIIHQGTGTADETYPGDGGPVLIDPDNSQVGIHSLAIGSSLVLNTDGGRDVSSITAPNITPSFGPHYTYLQVRRDGAKPTRIITAGQQVAIADAPMDQLTSSSWSYPFDLGSGNTASAVDVYNGTAYVGYCSSCETIVSRGVFANGIATNAGGTWHQAAAVGLPHRIINAVLVDHTNPNTVYVGLGAAGKRQAFHPGVTGADGVSATGGLLYKSTDGGATFTDITGSLPKVGVTALQEYGTQLIVGSVLGPFISSDLDGTSYGKLGTGIPATTVDQIVFRPGHPHQVYVSTYGRGIYQTTLPN